MSATHEAHFFRGKTLLLTGASMGIGRALAVALAREGVHLVINARSGDLLRETLELCAQDGAASKAEVGMVAGDASRAETVAAMLEAARALGNFQGFIHAAGQLHPGPYAWELSSEDFQAVFAANVLVGHQLIRCCLPDLLARGEGLAVFFGSGAAQKTQPGIAAYCAAKAAEEHLARQLAAEAPSVTTLINVRGSWKHACRSRLESPEAGQPSSFRPCFGPGRSRGS